MLICISGVNNLNASIDRMSGLNADVVLHRQQEQYDQKWDAKYQELVAYHGKHGTANVPQSEGVLGRWVGRQREAKKKGLPEDRVQLLVSFGS